MTNYFTVEQLAKADWFPRQNRTIRQYVIDGKLKSILLARNNSTVRLIDEKDAREFAAMLKATNGLRGVLKKLTKKSKSNLLFDKQI